MFEKTNIILFSIINLLLIIGNILSNYFLQSLFNYLLFLNWVLLNSLFDTVGYGLIINKNEMWFLKKLVYTNRETDFDIKIILTPYRVMQFSFFFLSLGFVLMFDLRVMIYCVVVWWFGFLDYLYYIVLRATIDEYLSWMENWSVHWLIKRIFGYECNKDSFVICAYVSIIFLSILILLNEYAKIVIIK